MYPRVARRDGVLYFERPAIFLEKYSPKTSAEEVELLIGLVSVSDRAVASLHAIRRHHT